MLKAVDDHLDDERLHIVAAPGAGKTTLGLEVVRRLGRPALVLAPTLAIRDQWVIRLRDFLPAPDAPIPGWISRDLEAPGHLTVVTYQTVLARHRPDGPGETADVLEEQRAPERSDVRSVAEILRRADLGTLVLDEAHHLRQEWWRALSAIVDDVADLKLVSLTATPPYDSTGREWRRYEELCGPIDDEISAPELVKAGTLSPHQDFVRLVMPTTGEVRSTVDHDQKVDAVLGELSGDHDFIRQVEGHPWIGEPDPEAVLDDPELAVALLVLLRATGSALPDDLLELLDLDRTELPSPSRRWWQILLHAYLYDVSFAHRSRRYRDALATRLRNDGLLWRRELRIDGSRPVGRSLALSAAKVSACLDVFRAESSLRGSALRQVVLTDYIRDEGWSGGPGSVPTELGALPVFDGLATSVPDDEAPFIAMVTGRLTVLHRSREPAFRAALRPGVSVETTPAPERPGWLRVRGPTGSRLVSAFTRLLADGELRVLVGTRSLLGEGWDAPCVNSVVLASYAGSFVSTNQMRGRGIRTDPDDPEKVASIWHLAALLPDTPTGVMDLEQLEERFRTFVGLSADGATIESGFGRLQLPEVDSAAAIPSFNAENLARHQRLMELRERWERAVQVGDAGRVIPTLQAPRAPRHAAAHTNRTLRYLLYEAGWVGLGAAGWRLFGLTQVDGLRSLAVFVAVAAGAAFLYMLPGLVRAARLMTRHLPVDGTIGEMGEAVMEALVGSGLVEPSDRLRVETDTTPEGGVTVSLRGGTFYEQTLFADAMNELLGPIENPRYLITREATAWTRLRRTSLLAGSDYHAVPTGLGVNKRRARRLLEAWHRHVGPGELVYTRREGGRRLLLAGRARSFSTSFQGSGAGRLDRWS